MDLIIADLPEGLPVPGISNPPSYVPAWNIESEDWFQTIFDFADHHLQDDGAIILFHPFRMSAKSNILGYCSTYGFAVRKEWWGMNKLHLTSPINPNLTVSLFYNMTRNDWIFNMTRIFECELSLCAKIFIKHDIRFVVVFIIDFDFWSYRGGHIF